MSKLTVRLDADVRSIKTPAAGLWESIVPVLILADAIVSRTVSMGAIKFIILPYSGKATIGDSA